MKKRFSRKIMSAVIIATMMIGMASCGSKISVPDDYNYDDLSAYIKLTDYKGIEYTKITGEISDDEVKAKIDEKLASGETEQIKEGTVEKDSVVNIDYEGSIDGVKFEGGTAQNQELDIANSAYIAGFAEAIVGHKVGETFDINVVFPEDYGKEELNGKPAVFKITVNYIVGQKKADFNDEWVQNNSEYKTTEEYEKSVRDELSQEVMSTADNKEKTEVFNKIVDGSEIVEYPEKELTARTEQIKKMYSDYAESSGMKLDEFLSSQMGMDADQFNTMADETAKTTVKQELVLYALKNAESIEADQAGYDKFIQDMLKNAGLTEKTFKEQNGKTVAEYAEESNLYASYLYQEVMNKVMEYSVGK